MWVALSLVIARGCTSQASVCGAPQECIVASSGSKWAFFIVEGIFPVTAEWSWSTVWRVQAWPRDGLQLRLLGTSQVEFRYANTRWWPPDVSCDSFCRLRYGAGLFPTGGAWLAVNPTASAYWRVDANGSLVSR